VWVVAEHAQGSRAAVRADALQDGNTGSLDTTSCELVEVGSGGCFQFRRSTWFHWHTPQAVIDVDHDLGIITRVQASCQLVNVHGKIIDWRV
jgi:hypothetical protein